MTITVNNPHTNIPLAITDLTDADITEIYNKLTDADIIQINAQDSEGVNKNSVGVRKINFQKHAAEYLGIAMVNIHIQRKFVW